MMSLSISPLNNRFSISIIFISFFIATLYSQKPLEHQKDMLQQYSGVWYSSIDAQTDSISANPLLRMTNIPTMDKSAMFVNVEQWEDGDYDPILSEFIGYDIKTNAIIATGQNGLGEMFHGEGSFSNPNNWHMEDTDMLDNKILLVDFKFYDQTDVLVTGTTPEHKELWSTRYVKQNPKDKNIGIQLVSVHKQMQLDPYKTLRLLDRFGYSFIETFVYKDRGFYGFSPSEFKKMVNDNHLKFKGSMTFYDLPKNGEDWDNALQWWANCIDDHLEAGVEYLTTSNTNLKNLDSLEELRAYCHYYNIIGKMCAEKGLKFAYHNHADEFLKIEGKTMYDFLLKNTDPEVVYFQADLYWMHVGKADPVDYLKAFPGRFFSWHVKDYQELGESGKMDFARYFEYSGIAGLQYVVAEVEDYNFPPLFSVERAWSYLYYSIL
tara:strand:- start:1073 stop:2377 length:1305 start_codon:yes stop_codon:yes gene_type:complete